MSKITLVRGYVPGAIGRVVEMHGRYYHRHWGFGQFFEAKVATELSEFLTRYDAASDGFWTVQVDGRVEGSISIDGRHAMTRGAHLRWFIVSDALRGRGAGSRLMDAAMDFCRDKGYRQIYLWTFAGLSAARSLYEKAGFALVEERSGTQWGVEVKEQRFELTRSDKGRQVGFR
ncbi:MAG: GNAT family N-acetyltransferase [Candidatus Cloacimonetes bacterium]|nr:GNAT family N-acetyltransferase [Candidatus Cloacimonadota bacterium]MDY0368028.1 GNAT family N-acetyltransferase [Candidatus Syntrophosphaera sp.]